MATGAPVDFTLVGTPLGVTEHCVVWHTGVTPPVAAHSVVCVLCMLAKSPVFVSFTVFVLRRPVLQKVPRPHQPPHRALNMMALTPLSAQSRRRLLCVGLCVLVVVTSTAAQPGTSAASGASSEVRPDGSTARRARAAAQPTPSPPSGHSGAAGGATNAAGVGATPTPAATPTPGAYVDIIYAKLNELFNSDSQLLTMEFPGRTLDEASFYYRVNDSNSQYLKPQVRGAAPGAWPVHAHKGVTDHQYCTFSSCPRRLSWNPKRALRI